MCKLRFGGEGACPLHVVCPWQNLEASAIRTIHPASVAWGTCIRGPGSSPRGAGGTSATSLRAVQRQTLPRLHPTCLPRLFSPISFQLVDECMDLMGVFKWFIPLIAPNPLALFFLDYPLVSTQIKWNFFYVLQILRISLFLCLFIAAIWPKLQSESRTNCFFCACRRILTGQIGSAKTR